MVEIIIIRHGETKLNAEGRIRGWSDVKLDDKGRKEATEMGKKLKGKLDALVCSDLDRAQETAHLIANETGVKIKECTKSFRPWHVGEYTGGEEDKVHTLMKELARKKPNEKFKDGESFNEFKNRFLSAVEQLAEDYSGERIGLVTHSRGSHIFEAWEAKGFPKDHTIDLDVFFDKGLEPGQFAKAVEYP